MNVLIYKVPGKLYLNHTCHVMSDVRPKTKRLL